MHGPDAEEEGYRFETPTTRSEGRLLFLVPKNPRDDLRVQSIFSFATCYNDGSISFCFVTILRERKLSVLSGFLSVPRVLSRTPYWQENKECGERKVPPAYSRADEVARSPHGPQDDKFILFCVFSRFLRVSAPPWLSFGFHHGLEQRRPLRITRPMLHGLSDKKEERSFEELRSQRGMKELSDESRLMLLLQIDMEIPKLFAQLVHLRLQAFQ